MEQIRIDRSALRLASEGELLANSVSDAIRKGLSVRLDFASVEVITPSFANALVMVLLENHPLAVLKERCVFENRSQVVIHAMNAAVLRHQKGIRLSTLPPASVA